MTSQQIDQQSSYSDLQTTQVVLEEEAVGLGATRYWASLSEKQVDGEEFDTGPVAHLVRSQFAVVVEALKLRLAPKQGAGRGNIATTLLRGRDVEVLALLTLRGCFAKLSMSAVYFDVALQVGQAVKAEFDYQNFKATDRVVYNDTQKHASGHRKADQRSGSVRAMMRRQEIKTMEWDTSTTLQVGVFLVDAVVSVTGMFESRLNSNGKGKTVRLLAPTAETLDWVTKAHDRAALFTPFRMPMVVKPKPWTSSSGGGYLTPAGGALRLIKTNNKEYLKSLNQYDISTVYEAINVLQNTAWQVNKDILDVAKFCFTNGIEVGGLLSSNHKPLPALPHGWEGRPHELKKADPGLYKMWAVVAAQTHEENGRLITKRISAATKLHMAEKFAEFPAVFYPYQTDFRGRVYPVVPHLQPQGDDLAKSLLKFAEGKAIGERGLWWLKVHIANCFGVDKVSFEDRVAWTEGNMDSLLSSAMDPIGDNFWMKASDPWQGLAAAKELLMVSVHGTSYKSCLPIPMDGSCNGLQNFSALLRDPVGGKATNLIPSDKPSDIYTEVAKLVAERVHLDALAGNELAMLVDGKINRKLVKQPVMTQPYGATRKGMQGQIIEAIKKSYPGLIPRGLTFKVGDYLAEITYDCIGQVVVAARQAMDWLQVVASVVAKEDYPLRWTSPIGLPVLQSYWSHKEQRVDFHVNGIRTTFVVRKELDNLNSRRQAAGISPNLIHSFDASHMMLTTLIAKDNGIEHLAMIHDSFGAHACDTDKLHSCIREAFIQQYSDDLLGKFLAELKEQLPDELIEQLPPLPEFGQLDLAVVRDSRYFFA